MKRIMAVCLCAALILTAAQNVFSMADSAECACVVNAATGEVIFSKNISKRHAMASTTKIMTAIIALENSNMDDVVTVSANAASTEGSAAYITENMEIYMRDLLYGLMLNSGNDAAVAIGEYISGSVDAFVDLMNVRAEEMGALNTHFVNPNGLYDTWHYTTAADLALIARYAMGIPEFREIVGTVTYEAHPLNSETPLFFANHNKMFEMYEGTTGIKTGYTEDTGRCLVSSAKRDDMEFIAVTLDDNDDWHDHAEMLDFAFSTHYPMNVINAGETVKVAQIDGKSYNMITAQNFTMPFRENSTAEVEVVTHLASNLTSPVNAGEKIGYLEVRVGGTDVASVDIVSEQDITDVSSIRFRNSFFSTFIRVIKRILV